MTEAQELLDREIYRLGTVELAIEMAQSELDKLESLTVSGVMASLLGTKAAKLDAGREDLDALRCEKRECEQAVEALTNNVAELKRRIEGFAKAEAEYRALVPPPPAAGAASLHDVRRARDAGKTLLTSLGGMYGLCTRLRTGPKVFAPRGPVFSAVSDAWGKRTAGGVTGQIADAVSRFREQLGRLDLAADFLPDVCAMLPQLEPFSDPSSLNSEAGADAWVELETVTKSIVADLDEVLRRAEG